MAKAKKSYQAMTAEELAKATAEFDREFVIDETTELSARDKKKWEKVKRKRGRPREGAGVRVISVSVEQRLLKRADKLAKKKRISRAKLIARGLRAVLAAEREK